jgi:alkaline phosphatase
MNDLDGDEFLKANQVLGLFDEDGINRSSSKPTQLQMTKAALNWLSLKS